MDITDNIIIDNTSFLILISESNHIFEPEYFGISPTWSDDAMFKYNSTFELIDYQFVLKSLIISTDRILPVINGIKAEPYYNENGIATVIYNNIMEPINFTGAIIIADNFVKVYDDLDTRLCYCYKVVKELIFNEGKLVTTIDHSKDMQRIRRNLDLGLRSIDKKRDKKCIQQFLKASFVGNYEHPDKKKKRKSKKTQNSYIEKIKRIYHKKN